MYLDRVFGDMAPGFCIIGVNSIPLRPPARCSAESVVTQMRHYAASRVSQSTTGRPRVQVAKLLFYDADWDKKTKDQVHSKLSYVDNFGDRIVINYGEF